MRPRGTSLFAQTMLLLLLALLMAQVVNVGMILVRPAPRPDIYSLSEIGEALAGRARPGEDRDRSRGDRGRRGLQLALSPTAPRPVSASMIGDARLTALLARALARPPADVRLFYEADQSASFPFRRRGGDRGVLIRRGEPLFFNAVIGAVRDGARWRVVRTPERPFINEWQRWTLTWFAASTLLLIPFAWAFTRRLTRPMRRFVEVADRFGREEPAPALPIEGPLELRTTAEALNRMQARIDAQIRERTSMIGAIAHDLRTPLARIAFRIEAAPDDMREKVQADVEQMRAMIAHTIAFVRGTSVAPTRARIDLAALLARIADHGREMERPVRLAPCDSTWVMGDEIALERLVDNLVNNALAFGGEAEITLTQTDGRAEVTVADRGPGLSEEMLSRAFEPFERGEPSRSRATGGVGLGLTIARAIARSHGGTLALANCAGGGLEARFAVPLA